MSKPIGRPRKDAAHRRVTLTCRVHPATLHYMQHYAKEHGLSVGELIDRTAHSTTNAIESWRLFAIQHGAKFSTQAELESI